VVAGLWFNPAAFFKIKEQRARKKTGAHKSLVFILSSLFAFLSQKNKEQREVFVLCSIISNI